MLTTDEVRADVRDIRRMAELGGSEEAHSMEDELHQKVLTAIATGECESPQECAKIAIKTLSYQFHRWCS